jgi:predicted DNA binding CopG/RHH family protein
MTPTSQSSDSEDKYVKKLESEIDERKRRGHATRPPRAKGRTTPIAVRFDEFTIKRLKDLAARRNTGYQTLLKEFVVERLYEEEKRERVIE